MSNDLAPLRNNISPPVPPLSEMSDMLHWLYDRTRNPHRDAGAPTPSEAAREEARTILRSWQPWGDAVTRDVVIAWLRPIIPAVRNAADAGDVPAWREAVILAVDGMPVGAFTRQTQQQALQTFKFFPSAADICEVLSEHAFEIRQRLRVLSRIASATEANSTA